MGALTTFSTGTKAVYLGRTCEVLRPTGIAEVLIRFKDTAEVKTVEVSALKEPTQRAKRALPHPDALTAKNLQIAEKRLELIRPLLNRATTKKDFETVAKQAGKTVRTIYRWLCEYETNESRAALAPQGSNKRARRISCEVEAIISAAIESENLTTQKKTAQKVIEMVNIKCRGAGLKAPNHKTVRRRIAAVAKKKATKARRGRAAARDKFTPVPGDFPDANHPLAVVQIDHHKMDVIIVDDVARKPIGRLWLTMAIDVFSRMVVGYHLSLEAPSATSVGMCIQNAILPKDRELADLGISARWDVWGRMDTLHADNGSDFRCKTVSDACTEHGIDLAWRPVATPNWGGRIERLFGTIAKEFHALPGTTFSNVKDREGYDSDKAAIMTFDEARRWLLLWLTGIYHERVHAQLGMSPRAMWERGILGDGKKLKARGIPPKHADPERLRLDFLPARDCTVQRHGIIMDHVRYYSDEIRHWIGEKVDGKSMKFKVRRDPLDISHIYFLDPERGQYIPIPYADISLPTTTLWELRAAKRELKSRGSKDVNEALIFRTLEEMQTVVETAKTETKKARRTRQRRTEAKKHREKVRGPSAERIQPTTKTAGTEGLRVVVDNESDAQEKSREEEYFEISDDVLTSGWHEWN